MTVHDRKVKVDKKLMRVTSLTSLGKVTIRVLRAKHRTDTELNKYQQKLFRLKSENYKIRNPGQPILLVKMLMMN